MRLGCGADLPHSFPYNICQLIARDLWQRDHAVTGIEYRSRWNDRYLCFALFDRVEASLEPAGDPIPLDHLPTIRPILRRYQIGII